METANLPIHAQSLRGIASKMRNLIEGSSLSQIDPDLKALTGAGGLARLQPKGESGGPSTILPEEMPSWLRCLKNIHILQFARFLPVA
jgi:hypothetical protein